MSIIMDNRGWVRNLYCVLIDFVDHLCYSCLVFVMLSRLFIAALWSLEGKGLASWLLFVMLM